MALAALAGDTDSRIHRAVTLWDRLTPAQRDHITLDQVAEVAGIPAKDFASTVIAEASEAGIDVTDLLRAVFNLADILVPIIRRASTDHPKAWKERRWLLEHRGCIPPSTETLRFIEDLRKHRFVEERAGIDLSVPSFLQTDTDANETLEKANPVRVRSAPATCSIPPVSVAGRGGSSVGAPHADPSAASARRPAAPSLAGPGCSAPDSGVRVRYPTRR